MDMKNWKNVNNWHWYFSFYFRIEKDCTSWSHQELKSLIESIKLTVDNFDLTVTLVSEIDGDVILTQRKGKIKYIYDLSLKAEWKLKKGEIVFDGSFIVKDLINDIPYNELDLKLNSLVSESDVPLKKILNDLKLIFIEKIKIFSTNLLNFHSQELLVKSDDCSMETFSEMKKFDIPIDNSHIKEEKVLSEDILSKDEFVQNIFFNTSVDQLFDILTNPEKICIWSRSQVKTIDCMNLFEGAIVCNMEKMNASEGHVKMKWKLSSWPKDHISNVDIKIKKLDEERVSLKLRHSNVPKSDIELIKHNWKVYYWNPIKIIFGLGDIDR